MPGSVVELDGGACTVTHPADDDATARPFTDKRAYLERVPRATGRRGSPPSGRRGRAPGHDLVAELAAWFEPLLAARADHVGRASPATSCSTSATRTPTCASTSSSRRCASWRGEPYVYKVDVDRALIEALVDDHVEDWVNSLFLSCRFTAHRDGPFNEFVHDVLQGALARAHRVRRAVPPRGAASAPTSSSSATAGASSAGARTARPTSPASARSTTACSRAASTTGASTSRPAAASRATTATSAASA